MTTLRPKTELNAWQRTRDILLVVTLLGSLIWYLGLRDWLAYETKTSVGTVQHIRYFGGLFLNTQIDTTERSFVASGITKFKTGQIVWLHTGHFESELCTPDQHLCEFVKGHPQ